VLVDPQITFTLHSNGAELFSLRPGNFRQRIVEVFGKRLNQDLLPLKVDTTLCKINGFVGKPESARKKGVKQFFFVNGRFMRHPYFHKAVLNAYERLIPSDEQIPYFLSFEVDPRNIDVNIHPTKTEIKFDNEQAIWQILSAAVRDAVGMFNDVPSIDFDTVGKPDIPVFNPDSNMVKSES
jgi:DNA mismatch repair protein MutL